MNKKYTLQRQVTILSLLLLMSLLLAACGFKLRGQTIALPFKSLYVLAPDGPGQILGIKLERAIRASPTTSVVMSPENAEAVIEIIGAITEKGILSLSGGGRVRDFNVVYRVAFRVINQEKVEIVPTSEVSLARVLPFRDEQILAKNEEETLLIKDMQRDAVQQILWRLSTYKPDSEKTTS